MAIAIQVCKLYTQYISHALEITVAKNRVTFVLYLTYPKYYDYKVRYYVNCKDFSQTEEVTLRSHYTSLIMMRDNHDATISFSCNIFWKAHGAIAFCRLCEVHLSGKHMSIAFCEFVY